MRGTGDRRRDDSVAAGDVSTQQDARGRGVAVLDRRFARGPSGDWLAFDVDEEVADRDVERAGQPPQAEHVEAPLTALDLADERAVHAGRLGQLFLRPAPA